MSLKGVVKGDSSVEKGYTLFEGSIGLRKDTVVYFVRGEDCWEGVPIGTRPFGEAQSKATRTYAQSGQYHIIVESRNF